MLHDQRKPRKSTLHHIGPINTPTDGWHAVIQVVLGFGSESVLKQVMVRWSAGDNDMGQMKDAIYQME